MRLCHQPQKASPSRNPYPSDLELPPPIIVIMAAPPSPSTNGHAKGPNPPSAQAMDQAPADARGRRRRQPSPATQRRSFLGWTVDKLLRLGVWYLILTTAFFCPRDRSGVTEWTPAVCTPYLGAKEAVWPYAQPYYQSYLEPYVARAQPYVDQFNAKLSTPAYSAYQTYGAPRVKVARKSAGEQWEKTLKPQWERARHQAGQQAALLLEHPQVKKLQPYYDSLYTSASDIWELELQPVYRKTAPFAQRFATQGRDFAVKTALPQARYAAAAVWEAWVRTVWPRLRVLYGENVEPQLTKIQERLGRYREGKQLEAEVKSAVASAVSSSTTSTDTATATNLAETLASYASAATSSILSSATPEPSVSLVEQFELDLKTWETTCSKAVEEGSDHLRTHISELANSQIDSQVHSTGSALLENLNKTAEGAISGVKARILSIVASVPEEDASTEELKKAEEDIGVAVRNAGKSVRESAQQVRNWKATFTSNLDDLVGKALDSTLETVDSIRDIRLSEIGRKYADRDLPHKEWRRYNDLKKATRAWRDEVSKVTQGNAEVQKAKESAEEVEGRAMGIAEECAKELGRLKEVGKWKVQAADASDDFESKAYPAPARKFAEKVQEGLSAASGAVVGSSTGTLQAAASAASEKAASAASSAREAVAGSSSASVGSAARQASSSASSAASVASKGGKAALSSAVESASDAYAAAAGKGEQQPIGESVKSAASSVSSAVIGTESGVSDSLTDAASSVSSAVVGTQSGISDSLTDAASSVASAVLGTESGISDSLTDAASSASSAILGTESAFSDSLTDAASSASSAIIGTESGLSDSLTDAASSVSSAVIGTPSGISDSLADAASSASFAILGTESGLTDTLSASASSASGAASSAVSSISSVVSASASSKSSSVSSAIKSKVRDQATGSSKSLGPKAASILSAQQSKAAASASSASSGAASVASDGSASASSVVDQATSSVASAASEATESAKSASKVMFGANAQVLVEAREPILDDIIDDTDAFSSQVQAMADAAGTRAAELTQAVLDALNPKATPTDAKGTMSSVAGEAQSKASEIGDLASDKYEAAMHAASEVLFGTKEGVVEGATKGAGDAYSRAVAA